MRKPFLAALLMVMPMTLPLSLPVVAENNPKPQSRDGAGPAAVAEEGSVPSAVDLYRRHISPLDGDRCPMYPSCSQYSLGAFHRHGLIMGWIMTCDRLIRCGRDELSLSPRIIVNGRPRCYDPVEDNDFWWSR